MACYIVSGSASGIGGAVREMYTAAGHTVIGIDIRNADICADLSTAEGRQQAIEEGLKRCGGTLDGLILCAGLGSHVTPAIKIAQVNYFGMTELLDAFLPALQKGKDRAAVVVSSVASVQITWDTNPMADAYEKGDVARIEAVLDAAGPKSGHLAYASSKNAVTVAVRRRVVSWGKAGVRLNTVAPGAVNTPLLLEGMKDPRYGEAIKNFVGPIGRNAVPAEIAQTIGFLMGSQASFVHGTQLYVDGGMDALVRPTQF